MLEIAVSDGVLSSYAKLENIVVEELKRKGDTCIVKAQTKCHLKMLEITRKVILGVF